MSAQHPYRPLAMSIITAITALIAALSFCGPVETSTSHHGQPPLDD